MEKKPAKDSDLLLLEAFQAILRESEDYVFVKDIHFVYYGGTESFAHLAGRSSIQEVIGKTDFDLFSKELAEKYRIDDETVFKTKKPIRDMIERIPSPDGTVSFSRTMKQPIFAPDGRLIGIYGYSRNITERMSMEEELKTTRKYTDLISKIPGGVAILHVKDGQIVLDFANDAFFQAHLLSPKEGVHLLGKDISDHIFAEDINGVRKEIKSLTASGQKGEMTYRIRDRREGKIHWIFAEANYAYRQNGMDYYYASYTNLDEQKANEERIREGEENLKEAIDNSKIQYFTYFPNLRKIVLYSVNKAYTGIPSVYPNYPDSFIDFVRLSPVDAEKYRLMVKKIDDGENEAQCVVHMAYLGVYFWMRVKLTAVKDEKGRTIKALGYALDVTATKNSEDALEQERQRLRSREDGVFETFSFNLTRGNNAQVNTEDKEMLSAEITPDLYARAIQVSPSLADSKPETRDILLKVASLIPTPEEQSLFVSSFSGEAVRKAFSEGRRHLEATYRRKREKGLAWVSTTMEVLPDPDSGDLIAFFYTKDISETQIKNKILENIYDLQYKSIYYLDLTSGLFKVFSSHTPGDEKLDGLPYAEARKILADQVIAPEDKTDYFSLFALSNIRKHLETDSDYILYYKRKPLSEDKNDPSHKATMKNDIFYLDEKKDEIVFLLSDVTAIFEAEKENRDKLSEALRRAEDASLAKSQFLSRMSYEIRTPMNAIIGLDAIALQEKDISDSMRDHLEKIGVSAHFLLSLINDILDMSRIESGRMQLREEAFSFEELINGISTILYQQCLDCGLTYDCQLLTPTEETYIGDVTKLQQVLVNMLGNAVKFTPRGGKVSFQIAQVAERKGTAKLRFVIADNGIGIDSAFLPNLFHPFSQENRATTTAYGGTGLGLAISKNIVTLMGGEISVQSTKNVGSVFTVLVPLRVEEKTKVSYPLPKHKIDTLVVDDDPGVCENTKKILEKAHFHCESVLSGELAYAKVKERKKKDLAYDLILLDWKMPGWDGLKTAQKIREIVGPEVTIIIMSAYDWADIEKEARKAGVNSFVAKPVFPVALEKAYADTKAGKDTEEKAPDYDFTGRQILLAEDNEINAEIARTLLESKGAKVEIAKNGAEAVESFVSAPVAHFDVILMDVRMPSMDGLEATRAIRAMKRKDAKTIPVIAMTANAFQDDIQASLDAGMNAHLAKPIEPVKLFDTLVKFFRKD